MVVLSQKARLNQVVGRNDATHTLLCVMPRSGRCALFDNVSDFLTRCQNVSKIDVQN